MSWLLVNRKTSGSVKSRNSSQRTQGGVTKREFTRHCESGRRNVRDSLLFCLRSGDLCSALTSLRKVSNGFSVVSAEFQTQHCAPFHVRVKSMALCHHVCFVRLCIDKARVVCFFSTTSCTNMNFNITCVIRPSPRLDAHAFAD